MLPFLPDWESLKRRRFLFPSNCLCPSQSFRRLRLRLRIFPSHRCLCDVVLPPQQNGKWQCFRSSILPQRSLSSTLLPPPPPPPSSSLFLPPLLSPLLLNPRPYFPPRCSLLSATGTPQHKLLGHINMRTGDHIPSPQIFGPGRLGEWSSWSYS